MSRGTKLQEMEQSKTAVNANAPAPEAMQSGPSGASTPGNTPPYEDLGGPTPENNSPIGDSNKLKTPGKTIKQVSDVVTNRKAATAKEEVEVEDQVIEEDQVVAEDQVEVSEDTVDETVDIEDDVNALLGGEELSEEFKEKAKVIFEAALNSKVKEIQETLEVQYEAKLEEEKGELKVALQDRVDSYLEYVAEEWMVENTLAIEHGLKTEMTESFLSGMKGLFEEHYVTIPEEKYDVLESMVEKLDDMETKLNEQIEKNIGLNNRLGESVASGILESVSDGLAATQKEKLASLSESVEFESEESYREKLETLKESYFSTKATSPNSKSETLSEGVDSAEGAVSHSNSMSAYLKSLSAFKK